jgi:cytochrome o ubiquinol oxidase subunit 1
VISAAMPPWNFAVLPNVEVEDAYWASKQRSKSGRVARPRLEPIEMPRSTPIGFVISFFAVVMGFSLIWHIWWLAIVGLIGIVCAALVHAWRVTGETEISAETLMAPPAARGEPGTAK